MNTAIKNEKKWKRIQLKPQEKEDGTLRTYYLDDDGNEYFRYEDRTGYIIREASKKDTEEWFEELENAQHDYDNVPIYVRVVIKAKFSETAEACVGEEKEHKVMFIYNPAQEMIGIMHITEEEKSVAKIEMSVKNQWTIDAKGNKILSVVKRMWKNTLMYDRMYMLNAKKEKIFLDSDSIAS